MKTLFLFCSLLFITSCGEEFSRGGDNSFNDLGAYITADSSDFFSTEEVSALQEICESLDVKESYFENRINNSALSIKYTQSSLTCSDESSSDEVDFDVIMNSGRLALESSEEATPHFKYLETSSNGNLKDLCTEVEDGIGDTSGISRQKVSSSLLVATYILDSRDAKCKGDSSVKCATLSFAYKTSDGRYKVRQEARISIDLDISGTSRGVVTYKSLGEACSDDGQHSEKSMSYISIN